MIIYKEGNGSSKQESIIILWAKNMTEGLDAEYDYLDNKSWELKGSRALVFFVID